MSHPYADAAGIYASAGWPCVLPVPPQTKTPPPVGFTGAEGRDTLPEDIARWVVEYADHSIALRMPDGVIGIDVDQYLKGNVQKRGAKTLVAKEVEWGSLPATWTSTARGKNSVSRIYFFRVPIQRYATRLVSTHGDGSTTGDVEIIQRHHRYSVVWPSRHSDVDSVYCWYDPNGVVSVNPPSPDDLAWLPESWVNGLAEGAAAISAVSSDVGSGQSLLYELCEDDRAECAEMTNARLVAVEELARADVGSRHDVMTARVHHVVHLAAGGHTGAGGVIGLLRGLWADLTAGEDRSEELDRMLLTSARKAVTAIGARQVDRDPCMWLAGFTVPAVAPQNVEDAWPIGESVQFSPMQVIGTHVFDPVTSLDLHLAEAVLERAYPLVRFAYDAQKWLMQTPDRWIVFESDLSQRLVAMMARLLPRGDAEADQSTIAFAQYKRYLRFHTHSSLKAIASMVKTLTTGDESWHPVIARLGSLDAEPHILWAGGTPWDLRRAHMDIPMDIWVADINPSTPHLKTAAVRPELVPTPKWDAFVKAVWPDPEIRAWCLRVLSIAFTGYSDKVLPILLGERDRGKTQAITLLMSLLGSYAGTVDARLLSDYNVSGEIVFGLKGLRLAFVDEAPRTSHDGQERLKNFTGGSELTADAKYQHSVRWTPTHTLILTANDAPTVTDVAVRGRVRFMPCDGDPDLVKATRAAIGDTNSAVWRAEAPGVLAKMMAEAGAWLADPSSASQMSAPESIRFIAEEIAAEQDPILRWLTEETEQYPPGTASGELYAAFVAYCLLGNMRRDLIPNVTKWGRDLSRHGYPAQHTRTGKVRPLRIRSGHAPGPRDGLGSAGDQSVPGSGGNWSPTFPQVNPTLSVPSDQCDQLDITNICEGGIEGNARVYRAESKKSPVTSHRPSETQGLTCENTENQAVTKPSLKPSPTEKQRVQTETARAKRQLAAAERRQAAILAAAGGPIALPALLTADGAIREAVSFEEIDALLSTITDSDAALTVDVEHTAYPVGHKDYALRTVQLGNDLFVVVLSATDMAQAELAKRHLVAATALHAHSASADLVPLAVAGLLDYEEAWTRMFDTVVPAKLSDPASTGSDPSLKRLAKTVLDTPHSPIADEARAALFKAGKWLTEVKADTPIERSGWAQVDPACRTMVEYAGSDVLDCAALAKRLPWPNGGVLYRERLAQRMTARVAYTGLPIDGAHVRPLLADYNERLTDAAHRLRGFGIENPGSDQQIAAVAQDLGATLPATPTGRPSVAAGVLEPLKDNQGSLGEFVRARLDYQKAETALGLFLNPYHQLVVYGDGRARPTVYTLAADTGRMSCVRPNLQQTPREGGFRACLTADPGYVLISADFAGVELRVAAALSQDANLIRMLREGVDLHWESTRQVFGQNATKSDRYQVKRGNFGWLYGGKAPTLARHMGTNVSTAQSLIDTLTSMLPGVTEWSRRVKLGVESGSTQFTTYSGRVVHMPVKAPHAAPNYMIQGTARELLIDALIKWSQTRWGNCVLFPVHDEIVAMVPEADAQDANAALVECMQNELCGIEIVAESSEPSFYWKDSS